MIWKVMSVLAIFVLVVFGFAFMVENLPKDPVELKINYLEQSISEIVRYGMTPVFAENLRFAHDLISYSIEEDCDEARKNDMIAAFNIFTDKVKIVSFYETSRNESDIDVGCSNDFINLGDELFTAGEGGPSRIINTSGFKIIEEGDILLYNGEECDYPIVALHELGHVFGFAHSEDPNNIMYNTSGCGQRMSEDMVDLMKSLYSIESLGDARIDSASALVHGRYLDFNVSILNEGLSDIDSIDLAIFVDGERIDSVEIGKIEVGYGRTLRIENMRIPRSIEKVKFVLDSEDLVRELSEDNNVVVMNVG